MDFNNLDPKINEIINTGYAIGMIQVYDEIYRAIEFLSDKDVSTFLEIGTNNGGSFASWILTFKPELGISIDLPHADFGTSNFDEKERNKILSEFDCDSHFISGNSQDPLNLIEVERILNGRKIDFLFIDGDHTENGVTRDFFLYKHLVKDGGWIGFHDIKKTHFHHSVNCMVDLFWEKIEGDKVEFTNYQHQTCGIGIIQKNDNLKYCGFKIV